MATPEPSRDAWGLVPAIPDPPPLDAELGVTTDSEDWGQPPPRVSTVTRTDFAMVFAYVGWGKLRTLVLTRRWHRRKH